MSKKDKFSGILYVVKDDEGFYICGPDLRAVAEMGEKREVAAYKLHDIFEVEGKAVIVR